MNRTEIIQFLIDKIGAKKYLEIGMGPGLNFNTIKCDYKISVDPNPTVQVTHSITSDEFFNQNNDGIKINLDLIQEDIIIKLYNYIKYKLAN